MTLLADSSATSSVALSWIFLGILTVSVALALYCVFTIYRNPYFNELQKIGWLLLCLGLPVFGPLAWISRAHYEKKVQLNPAKYGVHPTPSVTDFAAKLIPVSDDVAITSATRSDSASSVGSPGKACTSNKNTRFAPTEFATDSESSDSPGNPHLSSGKDGGPRVLRF